MGAWLYILLCADGSYYVGTTQDSLDHRFAQHQARTFGGYTARRRPVTLVYHQQFRRITDAIEAERQVKGWRREKKEARFAIAYRVVTSQSFNRGGKGGARLNLILRCVLRGFAARSASG
jgi:putative endonuclease